MFLLPDTIQNYINTSLLSVQFMMGVFFFIQSNMMKEESGVEESSSISLMLRIWYPIL